MSFMSLICLDKMEKFRIFLLEMLHSCRAVRCRSNASFEEKTEVVKTPPPPLGANDAILEGEEFLPSLSPS